MHLSAPKDFQVDELARPATLGEDAPRGIYARFRRLKLEASLKKISCASTLKEQDLQS
jgi:hypothetical protein